MVRLFAILTLHFGGLAQTRARVDIPTRVIAEGVAMPVVSIGTGGQEMSAAYNITAAWLSLGGRGIDTAQLYRDQDVVAKAVRDAGIDRNSVFITSKIAGCSNAQSNVEESLRLLGTDYVDLMLIHFPRPEAECAAAWKTLAEYHAKGALKAIGVSNFNRAELEDLLKSGLVPAVNQMLLNVFEGDQDTIDFCRAHNITVEAFSPLGRNGTRGSVSENAVIQNVAASHNVSTYQVALKWILQKEHVLTFQSASQKHQESDADLFEFSLTAEEMGALDKLHTAAPWSAVPTLVV